MNNRTSIRTLLAAAILTTTLSVTVCSCVEEIDMGSRYTFVGKTVAQYLEENEETFSHFIYILKRGEKFNLMKAYGTYTCFAPTNEAIERHLFVQDSIYRASLLPGSKKVIWTGITSPDLEELSDSMCAVIAKTHILGESYLTTEMEGDVVPTKNLNDRYLTMSFGNDAKTLQSVLFINGARIILPDQQVENGVVHAISDVLNPSSNTIPTVIEGMPFLSIFSEALVKTGFEDKLQDYKDFSYVDGESYAGNYDGNGNSSFPPSRYYGFTAFCEPDELFHSLDIYSIDDLFKHCKEWYPNSSDDDNYKSPNNALYKFVAYHLVNKKLLYTRLVCYNLVLETYNSEVNLVKRSDRFEYYETMQGTLMKVTRPLSNAKYQSDVLINYSRDLTNANDPYRSYGSRKIPVNIKIYDPSVVVKDTIHYPGFTQEALNGSIHLLDNILIYDENVMSGYVLNEIMRFDFSSLVPEFTNNEVRWCSRGKAGILKTNEYYIPNGYGTNLVYNTNQTRLYYLCPNQTWHNYQGDEMMGLGPFDFKYKMPPVPQGTYEIRMGYSANNNRHVIQFYVDDEVTGIPVDLRILLNTPNIGYIADAQTDDNGITNDKNMKNRGYIKGPTTYYYNGSVLARDDNSVVRKVITTKYLGPGEHWVRFKNVKEDDNGKAQFMHDYLEIVPVGYLRREDIPLEEKRK